METCNQISIHGVEPEEFSRLQMDYPKGNYWIMKPTQGFSVQIGQMVRITWFLKLKAKTGDEA